MKIQFMRTSSRIFMQCLTFNNTRFLLYGLLMPLSFAPFHLPGMAFVSLALLYWSLEKTTLASPFWCGFWYGLGYFGFGVSWIAISMIRYGHLHPLLAMSATILFASFMSLYPALFCFAYHRLRQTTLHVYNLFLFASLWTLSEYLRASLFSGFPWLLTGHGQIDSFLKNALPFFGVFGTGFLTALIAALAVQCCSHRGLTRLKYVGGFSALIVITGFLSFGHPLISQEKPLSIGIVQGNIAMRDKWDEALFWKMLKKYQSAIKQLEGTKLIVLPESALPLPAAYIQGILADIGLQAKKTDTAILMGIPDTVPHEEDRFYNSLISLGHAKGSYYKQHLVPFGEYMPIGFSNFMRFLDFPLDSLKSGSKNQALLQIHSQKAAVLICYEIAFGELLRKQLPKAGYIVTISDDGWFGHSLAIYQHRQIAQIHSLMSQRYQILANNDGLSSLIDQNGNITDELPAWVSGTLKSTLTPNHIITPWVRFGEAPAIFLALIIVFWSIIRRK